MVLPNLNLKFKKKVEESMNIPHFVAYAEYFECLNF